MSTLGLELNRDYAMISSFVAGQEEPESLSPVAAGDTYQIPLVLAKRKGIGQWYYGDEAKDMGDIGAAVLVDDLYGRAMNGETVTLEGEDFAAADLLSLFLGKLIGLSRKLGRELPVGKLAVSMPELSVENTKLLSACLKKNDLKEVQFFLIDNAESFYYYALSQPEETRLHEVALFDLSRGMLKCLMLSKNEKTVPKLVEIEGKNYGLLYGELDQAFCEAITDAFFHRLVTSSYLTGDGFDTGWMKESLNLLCRNRKAFVGKNLYTKGACYAAMVRSGLQEWDYAYIGDNELKVNVSVKVRRDGELAFLTLLSAGESWYEARGSVEAILSGTPAVDLWLQEPHSREARIHQIDLLDFPERGDKETRLRITARPLSDTKVQVTVRDLGFGDIVRATEKHWEYTIEA